MGTKEQGGPEVFKFKSGYNQLEDRFFISLVSRKSYHTARLNLTSEEFKVILDRMVRAYEDVVYPPLDRQAIIDKTQWIDPDDEMKGNWKSIP